MIVRGLFFPLGAKITTILNKQGLKWFFGEHRVWEQVGNFGLNHVSKRLTLKSSGPKSKGQLTFAPQNNPFREHICQNSPPLVPRHSAGCVRSVALGPIPASAAVQTCAVVLWSYHWVDAFVRFFTHSNYSINGAALLATSLGRRTPGSVTT